MVLKKRGLILATLFLNIGLYSSWASAEEWQPAPGPLATRWAKDVAPDKTLPEYPRPQMVRNAWMNLNGLWDYAITEKTATAFPDPQGEILVPFPVESALS